MAGGSTRRPSSRLTALTGMVLMATLAAITLAASPRQRADTAAIDRFVNAASPNEAERLIPEVLASGITFDDALARLRAGRHYASDVPTGVVTAIRDGRFPYAIQVPDSYSPDRRYQVRLQLHGGVTRPGPVNVSQGVGRLAGAEQIYVLPTAWNEAMWWDDAQVANLAAILDTVKRTYNVDENRVALAGVSDGATGAYYLAMRNPTPYSAILPMIGFALVLDNPAVGVDGDLFPSNFRNRPFFIVNSGNDRLYPTRMVEPYVLDMARRGVDVTYRPQPDAGHDTNWWPDVKDEFETFVATHPRDPLPDQLSWETSDVARSGRLHWVVVDRLGPATSDGAPLDDLNNFTPEPGLEPGFRISDRQITQVIPNTSAEALGLQSGDVVTHINDRQVKSVDELLEALKALPRNAPTHWRVRRTDRDGVDRDVELSGTFAPTDLQGPTTKLFSNTGTSGRIDVTRTNNRVETISRGVKMFTLLLSPDDFDLSRPITVVSNGQTVYLGRAKANLATLLKWAARDNDRTMLFGAEVTVQVR